MTGSWWFPPVARGRIAALRVLAYAFIPLDVLVTTGWVAHHGDVSDDLYQPLKLARLLHLPTPSAALVGGLRAALLTSTLVALWAAWRSLGRVVRIAGLATAGLYLWWMLVAMSYGKVDHDRFAFLVLLFVLPTVGAARRGDRRVAPDAGWAVRMVQVAVVATYFLAAWAKVRIGGWGWVNGGTLAWAVVRRGTVLSEWMLNVPWILQAAQWGIVAFELASPLLFALRAERARMAAVAFLYGFHLVTFAGVGIIFLPHLVALASFLPLERLRLGRLNRASRRGRRRDACASTTTRTALPRAVPRRRRSPLTGPAR